MQMKRFLRASATGPALMAMWSKALPLTASFSHHCLGSGPTRSMLESCQWLGVRRWFLPGTPVFSTSYNWIVTTLLQFGRKSDEKRNSKSYGLQCQIQKKHQKSTYGVLEHSQYRFLGYCVLWLLYSSCEFQQYRHRICLLFEPNSLHGIATVDQTLKTGVVIFKFRFYLII